MSNRSVRAVADAGRTRLFRATLTRRLLPLTLVALVAGCFDEDTVFLSEDTSQPPPAEAVFLGYQDSTQKILACAECHPDKAASWMATGHATAWEDLQASGHAQDFCEGCHTVSELGSVVDTVAGYNSEETARLQDVQCESCHGLGGQHWTNTSRVLAPLAVASETGCGECHQGTHHPFVEQWAQSSHGLVPHQAAAAGVGSFCLPCHDGKTALEQTFGEATNYLERSDAELLPITCGVCHAPHGSPNTANLRKPIENASTDHLCVACHSRRAEPPSSHGPHGAQGPIVLSEDAGWIPPGLSELPKHPHGQNNEDLCATCHVTMFEVTDPGTGDFVFQSVGHTFEAIPCLDTDGLPVAGPCDVLERDFRGCVDSGCHSQASAARGFFVNNIREINELLDELWVDTDGDAVLDISDEGLLRDVVALRDPSQFDLSDETVSVAEGVLWNAQLAATDERPWFADGEVFGTSFSAHPSGGNGVHNPTLLKTLLEESIEALVTEYGLTRR